MMRKEGELLTKKNPPSLQRWAATGRVAFFLGRLVLPQQSEVSGPVVERSASGSSGRSCGVSWVVPLNSRMLLAEVSGQPLF